MVGMVVNVTVSEVAVAAVTVPTAPLLKTTVLLRRRSDRSRSR